MTNNEKDSQYEIEVGYKTLYHTCYNLSWLFI